jgi:hypothetical protein
MDETHTLERVQQLTQDYASYSQSRNGLGKVLGGVVGLIVALANGLIGPGWLTASLTIGLTIAWLISKEVIRRHFYQRFGEARERWVNDARRMHIGQVAFVLLVAVGATLGFIALGGLALPTKCRRVYGGRLPALCQRSNRCWRGLRANLLLMVDLDVYLGGDVLSLAAIERDDRASTVP